MGRLGLTRLTTARTWGKPPPSPLYYIMCFSTRPTSKWHFVPRLPKLGLSWLWGPITLCADLIFRWGLKQSCTPQWNASQSDEIMLLISYVSYWHALKAFEVELFKWEMEVGVKWTKVLHNIILQWENKTIDKLKKHLGIGTQPGTCFHPINTFWKRC
jgi:hypothetical protein